MYGKWLNIGYVKIKEMSGYRKYQDIGNIRIYDMSGYRKCQDIGKENLVKIENVGNKLGLNWAKLSSNWNWALLVCLLS